MVRAIHGAMNELMGGAMAGVVDRAMARAMDGGMKESMNIRISLENENNHWTHNEVCSLLMERDTYIGRTP